MNTNLNEFKENYNNFTESIKEEEKKLPVFKKDLIHIILIK